MKNNSGYNEITGQRIINRPANNLYRDNYDLITWTRDTDNNIPQAAKDNALQNLDTDK